MSRDQRLFQISWDLRYWAGQLKLPGADHAAIAVQVKKLVDQAERLKGEQS